ncbi:MAG TPA: helix-turn-helix domain-containing protein [Streptosporangiaceae bacterium]|jgi:excisionase family DNA binding protein
MNGLRHSEPPEYLTPEEVAAQLRVSLSQVYALVKKGPANGGLDGAKFGRLVRITAQSVKQYREAAHAAALA